MRRVPQEVVHSLWSRLFCGPLKMRSMWQVLFCGPLKMRRVPEKGVFMHRMPFPYRKRLFFTPNASENASRTPGSLFEHGTHIPYHRWPSPVPNARHRGRLPPQRLRLPYLRRDNQVINLIEVRSFRRASENASHLVVRSTGKRVAVASERPVYPRTGAVSGTECRRRGRGRVRRSGAGCHVSGEIIKS